MSAPVTIMVEGKQLDVSAHIIFATSKELWKGMGLVHKGMLTCERMDSQSGALLCEVGNYKSARMVKFFHPYCGKDGVKHPIAVKSYDEDQIDWLQRQIRLRILEYYQLGAPELVVERSYETMVQRIRNAAGRAHKRAVAACTFGDTPKSPATMWERRATI